MWSGDLSRPISIETYHWYKELLQTHRFSPETESGLIGIGRDAEDESAVTVFVGARTDLSNKGFFPDKIGEDSIVYKFTEPAQALNHNISTAERVANLKDHT